MKMFSDYINHQVDIGLWNPIRVGRRALFCSHLFYADDLTLMAKANGTSILSIKNGIDLLCNL